MDFLICPQCRASVPSGTPSCANCGASFAPPVPHGPPPPILGGSVPPSYGTGPAYGGYGQVPPPQKAAFPKWVIALILVVVAVPILGIVAAIAIPSLLAARKTANESAAVGHLRTIAAAEATYLSSHPRCGHLSDLVAEHLLDGAKYGDNKVLDGYRLRDVGDEEAFEIKMEPESRSKGGRSFTLCDDYVVRFAEGPVAPSCQSGKPLMPN